MSSKRLKKSILTKKQLNLSFSVYYHWIQPNLIYFQSLSIDFDLFLWNPDAMLSILLWQFRFGRLIRIKKLIKWQFESDSIWKLGLSQFNHRSLPPRLSRTNHASSCTPTRKCVCIKTKKGKLPLRISFFHLQKWRHVLRGNSCFDGRAVQVGIRPFLGLQRWGEGPKKVFCITLPNNLG